MENYSYGLSLAAKLCNLWFSLRSNTLLISAQLVDGHNLYVNFLSTSVCHISPCIIYIMTVLSLVLKILALHKYIHVCFLKKIWSFDGPFTAKLCYLYHSLLWINTLCDFCIACEWPLLFSKIYILGLKAWFLPYFLSLISMNFYVVFQNKAVFLGPPINLLQVACESHVQEHFLCIYILINFCWDVRAQFANYNLARFIPS